jgi:hypothetical protein
MNRGEFEIYCEFYKRKQYDKIPIGSYPDGTFFYMTKKQIKLLELLNDKTTTYLGYGGSARSGKTIIEVSAMIFECFLYPDIAWGLARKELTILKKTAVITLHNQFKFYGIEENKDYKYSDKYSHFTFSNKSQIFLIDSMYKPSDLLNTRFGGFELTRCAVDESNETNKKVVEKLFERTGWRNNDKYNLKRKLLETFNPAKNHIYTRYYKPYRDKKETDYKKFIPALPGDNPNPSVKEWVDDMIKTADKITIQRQIHGNFDYDDDPSSLIDYDALTDMFYNTHVEPGKKRISSDLAMQGRDRFLSVYWSGYIGRFEIDKEKSDGKEIEKDLKELKNKRSVGNSRIIADADGLGNYLESYINNIYEFRGGNRKDMKEPEKYFNLKSELAWKLAEKINKREIYIICNEDQKEKIMEEVSFCLKRVNLDDDTKKKRLISKEKMKSLLGRSPDYLDVLIMGMSPGKKTRSGQRSL